jgi:hypothetical protein
LNTDVTDVDEYDVASFFFWRWQVLLVDAVSEGGGSGFVYQLENVEP